MTTSLPDRFWSKVQRTGECWLWTASTNNGYGQFFLHRIDGRPVFGKAHRLSYEDQVGPIPLGLELDHLCRVRNCVRPDHLEPVTTATNQERGYTRNVNAARMLARTHCKNGHPYEDHARMVQRSNGKKERRCTICERQATKDYAERRQRLVQ